MARIPNPHQVRLVIRSLANSNEKIIAGVFNPSGKGSRAYHERNITNCLSYLAKWGHLATIYLHKR